MTLISRTLLRSSAMLTAVITLAGCTLPSPGPRPESRALPFDQAADTRLGKAVARQLDERPEGVSGVYPLVEPLDAFTARVMLASGADRTLDVQYYIWADDTTGRLLLKALRDAADRGVRVRLLLDDNGIPGLDDTLAALNDHENIQVRLFNPFPVRWPKWLGYLWDFPRLNRRMHNKSLTADSQASIIGGRNVADAYFGANPQSRFADLDVLALGPAARDTNDDFDRYWHSESAYPLDRLVSSVDAPAEQLETALAPPDDSDATRRYLKALRQSGFLEKLLDESLTMTWAKVDVISDDPDKVLGRKCDKRLMSRQLAAALDQPQDSVTLVSPYFIPGDSGVALFRRLEEQGVDVTVLTNSLAANDVAMVHSGYARYRKALLKAGITLYESRHTAADGASERGKLKRSSSSLHAKTFAIDGKVVFIGSFNFDPRSTHLNTEIGFLIDSPDLAGQMQTAFDDDVPQNAYRTRLQDGRLSWEETRDGDVIRHDHEPETGLIKRIWVSLLGFLPIESLL